jgi:excisionase family DNA binding protein
MNEDQMVNQLKLMMQQIMPPVRELMLWWRTKAGTPTQEWLSIEETAGLTGLSDDYVRRHVTSGLLPVANMGTFDKPLYRIRRRDIDDWMAKRREAPCPAPRKRKNVERGPGSYRSRHHNGNAPVA